MDKKNEIKKAAEKAEEIKNNIEKGISDTISGFFKSIMSFIHNYVLELIIISFILLGLCWAIGYFANALGGYHFELQSCWGGFSAIGGAGTLAAVKYIMDSWKNTPEGEAPSYGMNKINSIAGSVIDNYVSHQPNRTEVNLNIRPEEHQYTPSNNNEK
jgi:hypothetical protein